NGQDATLLIVNKKGGADTVELVDEVEKVVARFKERSADQFEMAVYHSEADKVRAKLEILSSNAVSGLVLVVIFLFMFLPGRVGLMASLSLPLVVMGTFALMPIFDSNLNSITILALVIALGM